jgi:hypothetical protein
MELRYRRSSTLKPPGRKRGQAQPYTKRFALFDPFKVNFLAGKFWTPTLQ